MLSLRLFFVLVTAVLGENLVKIKEGRSYMKHYDAPYQAVLVRYDYENDQMVVLCGGTLISKYEVLTSASCAKEIDRTDPNVFVRAGSAYVGSDCGTKYTISEVITHEKYLEDDILSPFNVAVVRVKERMNCKGCHAILLANQEDRLSSEQEVKITGYGESPETPGGLLRSMNLAIDDQNNLCNSVFKDKLGAGKLKEGLKCGSTTNENDQVVGPCKGDFGAPVVTSRLVGIVVYGDINCEFGAPAVINEIAPLHDWIMQKISI